MSSAASVRAVPATMGQWVSAYGAWFWTNLILGGLAILTALFIWAISNAPLLFPADLALGVTTLAITVAVSATDFPAEYANTHGIAQYWLKKVTAAITFLGLLVTTLATLNPAFKNSMVDPTLATCISLALLALATVVGSFAFYIQIKGAEAHMIKVIAEARGSTGGYADEVDAEGQSMKRRAKDVTDYNGIKI
ncbi:hypothetical protein KXS07_35375 [Inquilinus limosus]|uniref:hypothetical protein n=1 Tax=Inquilinus limosus TaxID=171674 RepID=UPI003F14F79C